jgi:response regulator NasT
MAPPLRILLAEDEPLNALTLSSQLESLGHHVVGPAADGLEAVQLAADHPVDLAILDIRMPRLSGLDAAAETFRIRPIPIILLTGYSDPELVDRAAHLPVYHYLVKPVLAEDLGPAIAVACARFDEWRRFNAETDRLRQKLEDRKIIDQAKGVLMEARRVSEHEAYRLLQIESQNRNQPMVEIARTVLAADSLLRDIERA